MNNYSHPRKSVACIEHHVKQNFENRDNSWKYIFVIGINHQQLCKDSNCTKVFTLETGLFE